MVDWEAIARQNSKARPCSICGMVMETGGHNAEPINSGKCCDFCNSMVIIPSRFQQLTRFAE